MDWAKDVKAGDTLHWAEIEPRYDWSKTETGGEKRTARYVVGFHSDVVRRAGAQVVTVDGPRYRHSWERENLACDREDFEARP